MIKEIFLILGVAILTFFLGLFLLAPFILSGRISEQEEKREK